MDRGLDKEKKLETIKAYEGHSGDTGSPSVQIALLTERISHLTGHLRIHKKDFATQRGLMVLVGRRRRLLRYFGRKNSTLYKDIMSRLGIRH